MSTFAVHDGATVVNVVVADSQAVVEEVTGLFAVETSGVPWVGWTMEVDGWRPPAPFPSWTWDDATGAWTSPVPYPDGGNGYTWDEESGAWVEMPPAPEPEPAPEE